MRLLLLCSIIFLIQHIIEAQKINDGLYVSKESKEFVYIYNDSIQFRINNKDAFGAFSIGKGYYKFDGNDKYYVYQCEQIREQTSTIDRIPRLDSLITIRINYKDNTPIITAYIYFKEINIPKKEFEIVCVSDTSGIVLLSEYQINIIDSKELLLQIEALGFSTEKRVVLERGYEYVVHSTIPNEYPFIIFRTGNIFIKRLDAQEIEVEICRRISERKRHGSAKLSKVPISQRFEFLLDKDITDKYYMNIAPTAGEDSILDQKQ